MVPFFTPNAIIGNTFSIYTLELTRSSINIGPAIPIEEIEA
jgi:hypothetical protein